MLRGRGNERSLVEQSGPGANGRRQPAAGTARIEIRRNSRMVARHVPIVRSMSRADQGYQSVCGYSGARRICWPTAHNVVSARLNAWRAERRSGWDVAEAVLGAGPLAMTGFARRGLSAPCCTRRGFRQAGSGRENRGIAAETMWRGTPQRPSHRGEEGREEVCMKFAGLSVAPASRLHQPAGYRVFR